MSKHRRPRWHDRPRAWLRAALDWACGRVEEVEDAPWCASPWCSVAPEPHPRQPDCPSGDHRDYVGFYPDEPLTDDHGNHISADLPGVERCTACFHLWERHDREGCHIQLGPSLDPFLCPCMHEPPGLPVLLRTAKVGGYHLPLSGDPENPWAPCAFRHDVARPDERPPGSEVAGPGYRQLTMWDLVPVRSPWKPRTWPLIVSGPRVCGGRIALLAGAR